MTSVMAALGPVESTELGVTLMHEHLFINLMQEYRSVGLVNNEQLVVDEISLFRDARGGTIVEVTPAELTIGASPDPNGQMELESTSDFGWDSRTPSSVRAIKRVSEATGVNIVLGTGHYRDPYLDSGWMDTHSVDQVSELLVRDLEEGISGTDVRAGIIGEIAADKWYISAREERSFRAAARAQLRTNAALTTHAARWPVGIAQLDLLAEEDVDPRRVIIGHCDSVPILEYHQAIARRGAFVQFDLIRAENAQATSQAVGLVKNMIEQGFIEQVLLSHDVCTMAHLKSAGGPGYAYISTEFAEHMRADGISDDEIDIILIENPRRALSGA